VSILDREPFFADPTIPSISRPLRVAPFRMSIVDGMASGQKVLAERQRFP